MNHDVPGKESSYTRDEGCRSELRKGMVAPIGGHDVVPGLRAAVIAHDGPCPVMAGQEVG
jgi:hypothetical protein